jgi:hypothetical protein
MRFQRDASVEGCVWSHKRVESIERIHSTLYRSYEAVYIVTVLRTRMSARQVIMHACVVSDRALRC